jgi:hypothetical protein
MKPKPKQVEPEELRMPAAQFDEIMRGAVQVAPEKPETPKGGKKRGAPTPVK